MRENRKYIRLEDLGMNLLIYGMTFALLGFTLFGGNGGSQGGSIIGVTLGAIASLRL
jgi:hypothetical protein